MGDFPKFGHIALCVLIVLLGLLADCSIKVSLLHNFFGKGVGGGGGGGGGWHCASS